MEIQILINHYRESVSTVKSLLESIASQSAVDKIGVIICSDGDENKLPQEILDGWPFEIAYIVKPHTGVCATRNTLLDAATAKYIMFCDCDDLLIDNDGVKTMLEAAGNREPPPNVVNTPFYIEIGPGKKRLRSDSCIWVFGKMFQLDYLRENNIRFPDEIPFSGDMYFLWQAHVLTRNRVGLKNGFYLWQKNQQSVTRGEKWHDARAYPLLIKTYTLLTENMKARGNTLAMNDVIVKITTMMYIDAHSKSWASWPDEYRKDASDAIRRYIEKYSGIYESLDERQKFRAYNSQLITQRTTGPEEGLAGIIPWIREVKKNVAYTDFEIG